jgi:hypothetical protein
MAYEHTRHTRAAEEVLELLYESAVTRYLEASGFDVRDHLTDEELAQYQAAQQVEFAAIFGAPKAIGKVIVEVLGGVAEVTSKPEHVEVEIIDHDNEEPEEQSALDRYLERVDMPHVPGEESRGE